MTGWRRSWLGFIFAVLDDLAVLATSMIATGAMLMIIGAMGFLAYLGGAHLVSAVLNAVFP